MSSTLLLQVLRGCYGLSKNRSYIRIKKQQRGIVIAFLSSERTMFIESDSTKVGETDTRQPPLCKARR